MEKTNKAKKSQRSHTSLEDKEEAFKRKNRKESLQV